MSRRILIIYYAATALFLALDFGFDVNVRAAFLEASPDLRLGYYGILFGCFALVLWRPKLSNLVGIVESLATLIALIMNMALRSMIVTDAMLESGVGFVTMPEVVNFVIVGGAAYVSWVLGIKSLRPE